MNYKVVVTNGADSTSTQDVPNVSDIQFYNEAHYFYDESNEVVFIAPQKSVVFIKKY